MSETVTKIENVEKLPVLALRGITVFPDMVINFDVERKASAAAVEAAMEQHEQLICLITQKDIRVENPAEKDLYRCGTICTVKQFLKVPGGGLRVMVEGISRAKLVGLIGEAPYLRGLLRRLEPVTPRQHSSRMEAMIRQSYSLFEHYTMLSANLGAESIVNVVASSDPGYIADYIAQNIYLKYQDKQKILEELRPLQRLELVNRHLAREIQVLEIEQQLQEQTQEQINKQQRDYVLREQMKLIQTELGEGEKQSSESEEYTARIKALHLPEESEEKLLKELARLDKQPFGSAEASVIRTYLDTCLELPWHRKSKERLDVKSARRVLDADHFGIDKVKERIIEYLAVKQLAPELKSPIICLVGPPGTGKTSIGMSIARAMNRKLARISLGGVSDEAEIRGHRKTYVGAMPGRIIAAIRQAGTVNPVLLLDEIDKLGSDRRGDPSAALLEALDAEQNGSFRDHFLEIPFDLSDVFFITTANTTDTIPRPLLDRMEIIELLSYTDEEKLQIAKRHLLPKQRKKHGLNAKTLKIGDGTLRDIIAFYTRESGVRQLEREIAAVCRKTAARIAWGEVESVHLRSDMLEDFLGVRKFRVEPLGAKNEVGLVRGLAWTSAGGEMLDVEVNVMEGSGKLELTGNLGDVMKESAHAALSYIRSRADKLQIEKDFYKNKDIHIHFPEGAIPKDGPSAGITITMAVISALTGAPVKRDVAMTGEITLRGRVLPIGGLKEKTMAALRAGIKTVIIPRENERDLAEIDQTVRNALNFVLADHVDEVLHVALELKEKGGAA